MNDRGKLYGWLAFVAVFALLNYAARFSSSGTTDRNVLYTWGAALLGRCRWRSSWASSC
jgi:hypothetical protein